MKNLLIFFVSEFSDELGLQYKDVQNRESGMLSNNTDIVIHNPIQNGLLLREGVSKLVLHDTQGQRMDISRISNHEFDMSTLPSGPYFVSFLWNGGILTKKIIKL